MGRQIDAVNAQRVIERAVRDARRPSGGSSLEQLWDERIREAWSWRSQKTAIAALGTALVAKSVDPEVDPLSLKPSSGPNGYAARTVAGTLARLRSTYGFVLGTGATDPLANSPWYEPNRIDRIRKWRNPQAGAELVGWLTGLSSAEAAIALVVFFRVAIAQAESEARSAAQTLATRASVGTIEQLIEGVSVLATLDAEDGRIGAAAVAAAFGAAGYRVEARIVNDPGQTDIDAYWRRNASPSVGIEVKQKVATAQDAKDIALGARTVGASKALLVALHAQQPALDREGLSQWADEELHVALDIVHGFRELFGRAVHASAVPRSEFLTDYVKHMSRWLVDLEASDAARSRWRSTVSRWDDDAASVAPSLDHPDADAARLEL